MGTWGRRPKSTLRFHILPEEFTEETYQRVRRETYYDHDALPCGISDALAPSLRGPRRLDKLSPAGQTGQGRRRRSPRNFGIQEVSPQTRSGFGPVRCYRWTRDTLCHRRRSLVLYQNEEGRTKGRRRHLTSRICLSTVTLRSSGMPRHVYELLPGIIVRKKILKKMLNFCASNNFTPLFSVTIFCYLFSSHFNLCLSLRLNRYRPLVAKNASYSSCKCRSKVL